MIEVTATRTKVLNYIDGRWSESKTAEWREVINPATGEAIAQTPLSTAAEVGAAVEAASNAFREWRRTPAEDRIQPLFKLKMLLEDHVDELGRIISQENGKTFAEGKAELRRAIENVEVACGIPTMMQGYNLEDVARGVDEMMIRQPLGVVAAITPFNFPGMIPFWFLPYAIATGNTFVLKPSERVPLTMMRVFELQKWSMRFWTTPKSAPSALWVRRPSPNTCTRARPSMEKERSARAARKTTSLSCPTPT
jgi:malonate-semialdehyde dehydrogenase (acetylating)/methylmalonate-semialdehyde dehydrogenase